jgi:hypothetical protein
MMIVMNKRLSGDVWAVKRAAQPEQMLFPPPSENA